MAEIGLGLIGCGGLGKVHAGCVDKIPGARFLAYADSREEAGRFDIGARLPRRIHVTQRRCGGKLLHAEEPQL